MRKLLKLMSLLSLTGWVGFILVVSLQPAAAELEKRVALVIGNGAYKVAPALVNPPIDARAVAAAFRRLGFEVIDGYDLSITQMRAKLAEFSAAIPDSKAAVVYYAGHGVSVDEENYLVPTDMVLKSPTDLDLNAVSLSLVLKQMKREERANVVILDACRDNPFATDLAHAKTRSLVGERGLSKVDSDLAKGTLLAFASDPKSTALDGQPGENSPFTKALLNHLEDPGASIDTVMSRVRTEVWAETKNKQMPWVNTSIIGELVLNPKVASLSPDQVPGAQGTVSITSVPGGAPAAVGLINQDRLAQENRMWDSAEKSNLAEDYQAYLEAYPSGVYAHMAKNRIAKLSVPNGAPPSANAAAPVQAAGPDFTSEALKAEVGSVQTERSLPLTQQKRKDIQQRLKALDFEPGKISGAFSDKTRGAIADWQKGHDLQQTGWLGPLQYAALMEESDAPLRHMMAEKPVAEHHHAAYSRAIPSYHAAHQRAYAPRQDNSGAAFMGGVIGGVAGSLIGRGFR